MYTNEPLAATGTGRESRRERVDPHNLVAVVVDDLQAATLPVKGGGAPLLAGKESSAEPIRRVESETASSELLCGNDVTEVNTDPPKAREIGCIGLR
jgi:hypothetical protein